jgi:hypothetical protein
MMLHWWFCCPCSCRLASGARVAGTGKPSTVGGITFQNYGAHCDTYPHTYLTAAAAIGGTLTEVKDFCTRLTKVLNEVTAKVALSKEKKVLAGAGGGMPIAAGEGTENSTQQQEVQQQQQEEHLQEGRIQGEAKNGNPS